MVEQGWSASGYLERKDTGAGGLPALVAVAVPLLAFLALAGFDPDWHEPGAFKWLFVAALGIACLLDLAAGLLKGSTRLDLLDLLVLALVAWVGLSLAWSPNTPTGFETLAKFACLAAVFVALRHGTGKSDKWLAVAVAGGALALLAMDGLAISQFGGYYNQNFETEALLLALPFVALLDRHFSLPWLRYAAWAAAALIAAYLLFLNPSKLEFLVWPLLGALAALALAWRKSRLAALGIVAALAAAVAAFVVVGWENPLFSASHGFKLSVYPRLELLANTFAMWRDHALLGAGAGSFNFLYPDYQAAHLGLLPSGAETEMLASKQKFAGAAHDEYIQYLAAFGLVGVVIAVAIVAQAIRSAGGDGHRRWTGLAVIVSCLALAAVEFPLQNPATALLAVLGAAWAFRSAGSEEKPAQAAALRLPVAALAALAVVPLAWGMQRFYAGHQDYSETVRNYNVEPAAAFAYNQKAVTEYPYDETFRSQLYVTLIRWEALTRTSALSPAQQDAVFATSLSAGNHPAVLAARLQYLFNSHRDQEQAAEFARWREHLRTKAPQIADVWLMETVFEMRDGNRGRAKEDLDRYLRLSGGGEEQRRGLISALQADLARDAPPSSSPGAPGR